MCERLRRYRSSLRQPPRPHPPWCCRARHSTPPVRSLSPRTCEKLTLRRPGSGPPRDDELAPKLVPAGLRSPRDPAPAGAHQHPFSHRPIGQTARSGGKARYSMRRPEMARAMTSCWICSVPSKMSKVCRNRPAGPCESVTCSCSPPQSAESPQFRPVLVPKVVPPHVATGHHGSTSRADTRATPTRPVGSVRRRRG